jgi:hypothetical protein
MNEVVLRHISRQSVRSALSISLQTIFLHETFKLLSQPDNRLFWFETDLQFLPIIEMEIDVWLVFVRLWMFLAILLFDTSGRTPYVRKRVLGPLRLT